MIARQSDSQVRIANAMRELADDFGYPPSMREVAASVGLSPSTVAYHLKTIEERGIITHTPQRNRTYQLLW
ncbi:LexA family protein [Streptomyces noursei]|uniref:LexA family protein n=1 Tax=Streptomyces noursei TaxID=1971 RepID=UPI00167BAB06|nr:winged helix-turn-helix transcriptional regulator [Streptomyces noursei]MCZ1019836.1 winged helix-turn-helix transcriptional regulator [Streptomyces noursei]GGX36327.1 hypothetical protein GCM10010341_67250 [Streptomyces noursei]